MVPQMRSPRRPCDFWEPTSLAAIRRFLVVEIAVRTARRRLAGQIEFRFETLVPLYYSSSCRRAKTLWTESRARSSIKNPHGLR